MDSSRVKKILILHASAGHGHRKAALALEKALQISDEQVSVKVVDSLDYFPSFIKRLYVGVYLWMIQKAPWLWGVAYASSDNPRWAWLNLFLRRCFNGVFGGRLERLILESRADAVIATHFMSAEVLAHLKRSGQLKSRAVTVITDFMVHRYWVFRETDEYFVASRRTEEELVRLGIDPRRVTVSGIPVDPKFSVNASRNDVRRRLGLDSERFTVLMTSGGVGSDVLCELARSVLSGSAAEGGGIQGLVVCGHNPELKARVDELGGTAGNLVSFGFVDNMDELMDASDVIVGKAGGLTLSEALAKKKIVFIVRPVPGQETLNAKVLTGAGAAFWIKDEKRVGDLVEQFRRDREKQSRVLAAVAEFSHPEAAHTIARKVLAGKGLLPESGR